MVIILKESKRKRKQLPAVDTPMAADKPKRTKVHAQRKFAQGQGNSHTNHASTSGATALASKDPSSSTSNSSKDNVAHEQIMPDTPQAKDFLTYVCFNRNPIFQHLNYVGRPVKTGTSSTSSSPQNQESGSNSRKTTPNNRTLEGAKKRVENSNYIPFGVRKQAEATPTLIEKKTTPTEPLKTEETSSSVRKTRSKPHPEEDQNSVKQNISIVESEKGEEVSEKKTGRKRKSNAKTEITPAKVEPKVKEVTKPDRVTRQAISKPPPVAVSTSKPPPGDDKSDFSSDDDKPLISAIAKKAKLLKAENDIKVSEEEVESVPGKRQLRKFGSVHTSSPVSPSFIKQPIKDRLNEANRTESRNSVDNKRPGRNKGKSTPVSDHDEDQNEDSLQKTKPKAKKKFLSKELEKLNADISQTTEISENDTKTARPTRKTKEAATIYMELIGHKLNLHDSDEEGASSLDSFPELPNVKRTEQMENELKQQVGKAKVEKRGRKPKKVADPMEKSPEKEVETMTEQKREKAVIKKMDKSFSDSDEEPLATKLTKKPRPQASSPVKIESKAPFISQSPINAFSKPEFKSEDSVKQSPKLNEADDLLNFSLTSFKSPNTIENRSMELISPEKSKPDQSKPLKQSVKDSWKIEPKTVIDDVEFLKPPNKLKTLGKSTDQKIVDESSPQSIANLMMNPLPSKEESGKIFGIASVTLAQSSGPQDTKCTLGRCGSVHKPLGPAVPTEALLGECSTNKERRKSKVNMSNEQIQKWLLDCNAAHDKESIPDDLSDIDYNASPKPRTYSPYVDPHEESSSSASKKITQNKMPITKAKNLIEKFDEEKEVEDEVNQSVKKIIQKLNFDDEIPQSTKATNPTVVEKKAEPPKKAIKKEKPVVEKANANPPAQEQSHLDRKPIYNRKPPVYNPPVETPPTKITKPSSFTAFSPENEFSVYSFDKEEDVTPIQAPPFRRHSRRESNNDESPKNIKKEKSAPTTPIKDVEQEVALALSPSASVALKVNLNPKEKRTSKGESSTTAKPNLKIATKTEDNDSDSEGHTIYIPLQGTNVNQSGKSDQLIQGVAVKLGTEGPDGCVVMKAKLVTKALGAATNSLSDAKTQEIMKTLMNSKDIGGLKPVPVGTVQPRFKSNEPATSTTNPSNLMRTGSNSSLISQKSKVSKTTIKNDTPIQPSNNTAFPRTDDPAQMVEAPVFRPTEKEFQDPMEFIERITPIAARFGLCRIIPPASFKPECRVSDDMRFTAYNQYVHKMLHRWGPSAKELSAIRKYLATQSISMAQPPWIGGMEVDLPRLYHTVQELGGLKEVIEKKKWARVAEEMCIPKAAQDRVTKLDDIYCKYLLPYDTLSPAERQKLFDEVEADWAKREAKARRNADRRIDESEDNLSSSDDEEEEDDDDNLMECIIKGRSMPLNAFFRIARNTMALWFKNTEPVSADVESEFWRHVAVRDSHVCVHSGSIDSSGWGYGFPAPGSKSKASPCAKHPWNLKVLTNNSGSVLRSLGPVMGVTVPTLHVGMLFSACCYYRDPHGLPWIEYLHTGGSKIWYGVPDDQSTNFRAALTSLVPTHCQNKTIWLPCDTAMVPPHLLTDKGVSLCRTEQQPGQFVVVFPRAYTSSISTGYVVSESVYFATNSWLDTAHQDFNDIQESCEPTMFCLEQLIFAIAGDQKSNLETLSQIEPMLKSVYNREVEYRNSIKDLGVRIEKAKKGSSVKNSVKASTSGASSNVKKSVLEEEIECDLCRANLFISMLRTETEDEEAFYCLQHGLMYLKKGELQAKESKLIYNYDLEEMESLMRKLSERIDHLQVQKRAK